MQVQRNGLNLKTTSRSDKCKETWIRGEQISLNSEKNVHIGNTNLMAAVITQMHIPLPVHKGGWAAGTPSQYDCQWHKNPYPWNWEEKINLFLNDVESFRDL